MPGVSSPGNFGSYKYGFVPGPGGGGINREDLLDQITNLDPYDTPWVTQAPKGEAKHTYHEWPIDTLSDVNTPINTNGAVEGADYAYDPTTTPTRVFNVTTILRQDIGVSETQRHLNPAGFKDAYAYEIQKATKRLAIKLEKMVFAPSGASTNGANGAARQMKSFQDFITTNTAFAGGVNAKKLDGTTAGYAGSGSQAGSLSAVDFNNMLDLIYGSGGNPEQCYVSRKVKRQVSNFNVGVGATSAPQNRNIAAVDKKLVSAIDFYDSDFGLIQIVLDRWVPEAANASDAAGQTDLTGQIFFLQRSLNRLAWLRPMAHSLVGKRGDSVAGIIVGEVTLEVLNEKGNGRILSVNNKSQAT